MATRTKQTDLAKIHIGKKQLGLDDDTYRAMLHSVAGVNSAAKLNTKQRGDVIAHLKQCGASFKANPKHNKPKNFERMPAYITKIEALLADMGLSWRYADSVARNITGGKGNGFSDPGIERLSWVKQDQHFRAIIAALVNEQKKRRLKSQLDDLLQAKNLTEKDCETLLRDAGASTQNWQRKPKLLEALITHIESEADHG